MQDLRARLINGGFTEVGFRILNNESSTNGTEGLWRLRYAAGHPNIPVLQEIPHNLLWYELLDGAVDHILVLDRCSRLTYQVITPWSILHFPYVKAAILSTYEDDPCGPCTVPLVEITSLEQNNTNSSKINSTTSVSSSTSKLNETAAVSNIGSNNSAASISETVDMSPSVEFPYYTSSEQNQSSNIPAYSSNVTMATNSTTVPAAKTIGTATVEVLERDKAFEIKRANIQENVVIDDSPLFDTYLQISPDQMKATLAPLTERADGTVPIRVVMHAPHLHRHNNGTVTQHEYLELQTGNPDYHGHLGNNNIVQSSNDEQLQKRKKYKGQRRKGKLRHESIQAQTQQENYEDTKCKHHRDKERPEKKKQKIKNNEQNTSEEEATTIAAAAAAVPLQDFIIAQPVFKDTLEDNTEAASLEIPQDIQEHYDYRNMPYFNSKHLHKPLRITETSIAVNEEVTERNSNKGEQVQIEETEHTDTVDNVNKNETKNSTGVVPKTMTSNKQIIKTIGKTKDFRKWKSNQGHQPPQKGNTENEKDVAEFKIPLTNLSDTSNGTRPQYNEITNSDQSYLKQKAQSQDINILSNPHTLENNMDLNIIDNEEHRKHKPNKAGKDMEANGSMENQPTIGISNEDDDESKKEIIQHYSQLLKWIHYSLPETRN